MSKGAKNATKKKEDVIATKASSSYPKWWIVLVVLIAFFVSLANDVHISTLFENDRHFSHLADFEREMAYRTEMGLYFSYYKTIVQAPTLADGLHMITRDNVTEHGHTINTLKRFNLYPEVFLAMAYRQFKHLATTYKWNVESCWQINRGDLPPVQGCEGIGNSHYFYIDNTFVLASTVAGSIFLLGVLVSDSIFGGLLAVASFFFNHGEATRVQWTPPLRESFGYPMIIAQAVIVSYVLKNNISGFFWSFLISIYTTAAMLFWQFSQFAFFTQVGSLFVVYAFDFIPLATYRTLFTGHLLAFAYAFLLLFGNEMLLVTFYLPSILAMGLVLSVESITNKLTLRPLYVLINFIIFIGATFGLKIGLANMLKVEDDAHILDILRSKFTDFANFHTRLYTCSAEFDFLSKATAWKLVDTLVLPVSIIGVLLYIIYFIVSEYKHLLWRTAESRGKTYSEVFYNVIQLFCYTVIAVLIMRLKLFFTPHLCIATAILANKGLLKSIGIKLEGKWHIGIAVLVLSAMAYEGKKNLERQWSVRGEYSNPDQEHLFNWITANTKPNDVFAGTMPVMANVKLSTERPIFNHPHYEDVGIRERTLKVYSMFSRRPLKEVHAGLKSHGVNYFVFQLFNCSPDPKRPYCAYRGMWDEQDPESLAKGLPANCDLFQDAILNHKHEVVKPFKVVYNNKNNYIVLKV